jgi:hypothetical protein
LALLCDWNSSAEAPRSNKAKPRSQSLAWPFKAGAGRRKKHGNAENAKGAEEKKETANVR